MQPPQERQVVGTTTLLLDRPPSTLALHREALEKGLRRPLPAAFADFYGRSDGLSYEALQNGTSRGIGETLCGLEAAFGTFERAPQFRTVAAAEEASLFSLPHANVIFSEDYDIYERGSLARLNALVRSKLLVSLNGQSAALVIDFAPQKGDYQLAYAYCGDTFFPLDLRFEDFVYYFERFGGTNWFFAFLTKKAEAEMNIDFVLELERSLAPFQDDFSSDVGALLKRAKARR
jgi:hypothetical protein